MTISTIVAVANNFAIGKDNQIPWYLPADLKYFKKTTLGHHIIMGRKCFQSIGRPLPKRTNVVLSRDPLFIISSTVMAYSIEEALAIAHENGEDEVFIIGGGMIYEQTKDLWDKLYLTEVDIDVPDADIFFPTIDWEQWNLISEQKCHPDEKNKYNYRFSIHQRKQA